MNRRDSVLALLVAAAAGGSLPLRAQTPGRRRPFVIGLLPDLPKEWQAPKVLVDALAESGRIEGRDYLFHHSGVFYGGDTQAALDSVMVAKPDLILALNLGFAIAAYKVTKTIPIVMWISGFPVEGGVADSLARPGRNVTGMTVYAGGEVFGKLVQLVQETRPGIRRVGAFMSYVPPFHPRAEADIIVRGMRDAAVPLGLDVHVYEISKNEHIDEALASVVAQGIEALVLTNDPVMIPRLKDIYRFAIERRLPMISDGEFRELGPPQPLLSYRADFRQLMRQAASYVTRILWQGAKPGDLPIQLPARFVFEVDLATAKAIGLAVPKALLLRADSVFE